MTREFSISAAGVTVAGATTLIFVNPAAAPNFNLEFLRFWIGQSANATSAQQRAQLETQVSAFPTLTAATPAKLKPADPNASIITGGTAGAADTAGDAHHAGGLRLRARSVLPGRARDPHQLGLRPDLQGSLAVA